MAWVLDTSALLAFLKQERGWQEVAQALEGEAWLSEVNRAEFYTYMVRHQHSIEKAETMLRKTEIKVVSFTQEQAILSALLYPDTRHCGLSLGDRACLALGRVQALPVLTADRIWDRLDVGVPITIIR